MFSKLYVGLDVTTIPLKRQFCSPHHRTPPVTCARDCARRCGMVLGPSPGVGTLSISTSVLYVHVWATAAGRRRAGPIALEVSGRRWRDGAGPFLACRSWDLDLQNGGRACGCHAGTSCRAAWHWLSDGTYRVIDAPMRDRGCCTTGACHGCY